MIAVVIGLAVGAGSLWGWPAGVAVAALIGYLRWRGVSGSLTDLDRTRHTRQISPGSFVNCYCGNPNHH
jgi:hypothetical protein